MDRVLFSSYTPIWETPEWLFNDLHKEFRFTLYVCALPENAKCKRFYTPDDDGLLMPWAGATCWCNPPYGNRIADWCRKAVIEARNGATTVMLLPARTDTRWFHAYVLGGADEIRFIKGRLKFGNATENAPFPSMLAIYKAKHGKV